MTTTEISFTELYEAVQAAIQDELDLKGVAFDIPGSRNILELKIMNRVGMVLRANGVTMLT